MKRINSISMLLLTCFLASCNAPKDDTQPEQKDKIPHRELKYDVPSDEELDTSVDSNNEIYNPSHYEADDKSPLKGKTIYWLGSSVTYGASSEGNSMADYIAARSGCISIKEAVSGTTIYNDGSSADTGTKSYVNRLKTSSAFNVEADIDAFVCQISTNDCLSTRLSKRGRMTPDDVTDINAFDIKTTLGGVEYIIAYVAETWGCPIYFYSGAKFVDGSNKAQRQNANPSGTNYATLVEQVHQIAEKWDSYIDYHVSVIDLFNDEGFNAVASDKYYAWATNDPIHPKKAGYAEWWSPYIQNYIENDFIDIENNEN